MNACRSFENLPTSICKLRSLEHLKLCYCPKLKKFPEILEPMQHLKTLELAKTGISELPSSVKNLIGLQRLCMWECKNLMSLPNSISNLNELQKINLFSCQKLDHFPPLSTGLHSLTNLNLSHCNLLEIPDGIGYLSSLQKLYLNRNFIKRLPASIKQISKLIEFEICNCKELESLPELPLSLEYFDASGCKSLKIISNSTVLTQGWWDDYNVIQYREFSYYDCLKLDQNTCNNIVTEFQLRTLQTATKCASTQEELKVCVFIYTYNTFSGVVKSKLK